MSKGRRTLLKTVLGVVLGLALLCGGGLIWLVRSVPSPQGDLIEVDGLAGVHTGGAWVWVVRTAEGAVLVDSGGATEPTALLAQLERMGLTPDDIHTVLLTHGHSDHTAGLGAFPEAEVIAGPGEAALVRGEKPPGGALPRMFSGMAGHPWEGQVREARDGEVLVLGGEAFQVIHVPGHTGGSTMYLWRDTLFSGDSLGAFGGTVGLLPALFADDIDQNRASLHKLLDLEFARIADGHGGLEENAKDKLHAFLGG
ncbi:MAG: MBL fold metallo-hydrolase [Deltaproteobacteria bacterium]|nr:MBL fold metallo-hydrolase [Deltaproteobacteria bacterium]MBW2255334.1 MBL fold metallo-hydrolase [Deltaproteobacteria bacterium]